VSDMLAQFGIEAADVAPVSDTSYPKPVEGRVCHVDADFLAYQVSAESTDELDPNHPKKRKTFADMQANARSAVEHTMRLAGATSYVCHTTPNGSTKGGRSDQAVQKEYQANRADTEKPALLDQVRVWIGQELNGRPHLDQEADDGLAQANYGASDPNLCVLASADKDLLMVPGLHLDMNTGKIFNVEGFGETVMTETKGGTKKIKGGGTKFFWQQLLQGDAADNIQGLPVIAGVDSLAAAPTQEYLKLMKVLTTSGKTSAHIEKAEQKIDALQAKTKLCGAVMAFQVLEECNSDAACFKRVSTCYNNAEKYGHVFTHWRTGDKVSALDAMLGDMHLLWMRRNKNPSDVIDWLKGVL